MVPFCPITLFYNILIACLHQWCFQFILTANGDEIQYNF